MLTADLRIAAGPVDAEIGCMTRQALLSEILRLPPEERIELLGDAWDAVASDPEEVPVPEWHLRELERRVGDEEADYIPWGEVRDRLEGGP